MMIHAEPDYEAIFFRIVPVWSSKDMVFLQEEGKIFFIVSVQLHTQVACPIFFHGADFWDVSFSFSSFLSAFLLCTS